MAELRAELSVLERRGWDALCDSTGAEFYGSLMTEWQRYELADERLVAAGDDAAILTYTGRAYRAGEDDPFVAVMSSVHVRRDGDWRLALYQQTPAG